MRNLLRGQGEVHTTEYLLDYEDIKNHFRSIAVDLSWQKELDADPKAISQIEFAGQLKNTLGKNADSTQFCFFYQFF